MDEPRASKRLRMSAREADTINTASAPTPTHSESPGTKSLKPAGQPVQNAQASTQSPAPTKSAREIWQEAKAMSKAGRQKAKQDALSAADATLGGQRAGSHASLRAPKQSAPAKRMSTLGFFQQFQKPKAGETNSTPVNRNRRDSSHNDTPAASDAGSEGRTQIRSIGIARRSTDKLRHDVNGTISKPTSRKSTSKKTSEHEKTDIEQQNRTDIIHDDITLNPKPSPNPRVTKKVLTPVISRSLESNQTNRTISIPISGRKANFDEYIKSHTESRSVNDDAMEIDNSDDDRSGGNSYPTITTPSKQRHVAPVPKPVLRDCIFTGEDLGLFKAILLDKLTGKRPIPLTNLDEEYTKVGNVVGQTITAGESNSMLLIGARGSGKTAMIKKILQEHTVKHADDFLVVKLNGFIHTDDKIALREIWRQLGREMDLDDTETATKNFAVTLTTLLALLSHPAELGTEQPNQITKSVIFILDEFELFATHPRQTLLYNLFDIAQSRKAPIVVLGLTTRVDVTETLEKRVKSRFSHRYVHLSLAKSFQTFQEVCLAALTIQDDELSWDEQINTSPEALRNWNAVLEGLMFTDECMARLKRLYYTTKSVPDFMLSLLAPIATLQTESDMTSADFTEYVTSNWVLSSLHPPDSKLSILASLCTLQLALLISAARLVAIHDTDVVSFALAYDEYKVLASKAKLQASASGALAQGAGSRISSKEVARDAWAGLIDSGLVMGDHNGSGRIDVGLEEIVGSGTDLGQWSRWCKEI
ncbi:Hypothetical protein R9X50_00237300 [Acrodontium crateriforme]|uniref:Origin recognition complex subunit 4 n=1 Tax=Acrodontium crateriforme TaxID=150365 RepID=A0AAQ3M230_9PEZI|nr:Hypothetical protein R9X50_00237300 [Acrodontium crateriforme]